MNIQKQTHQFIHDCKNLWSHTNSSEVNNKDYIFEYIIDDEGHVIWLNNKINEMWCSWQSQNNSSISNEYILIERQYLDIISNALLASCYTNADSLAYEEALKYVTSIQNELRQQISH